MDPRPRLLFHSLCFYALPSVLLLPTAEQTVQLTNVALNKPATLSTYHDEFNDPQKAVDGNTATHIEYCVHTGAGDTNPDRWWRVDLQGLYQIHHVVITNRGDCCGYRLANIDIIVDRYIPSPSSSRQDSSLVCLHRTDPVPQGATVTLSCSQPVVGRYVTLVQNTVTEPLNFCEMEVLAAMIAYRLSTFHRHQSKKATADVIKTVWVRSVIGCINACVKESGCTAVNLQTRNTALGGAGSQRVCELLTYSAGTLQSETDWDFYRQHSLQFDTALV